MEYVPLFFIAVLVFSLVLFLLEPRKGLQKHKSSKDDAVKDNSLAEDIIDSYIEPAMFGVSPGDRLSIRKDLLKRFSHQAGAKTGEHQFNDNMLHLWMKYNAARLIVEHRNNMQ